MKKVLFALVLFGILVLVGNANAEEDQYDDSLKLQQAQKAVSVNTGVQTNGCVHKNGKKSGCS